MEQPKPKKHKKKSTHFTNKYEIDEVRKCYLCDSMACATHEVFFGQGRRYWSDVYNLQVYLCASCHEYLHAHKDGKKNTALSLEFQLKAMDENNWNVDDFRKVFNCNYVKEIL